MDDSYEIYFGNIKVLTVYPLTYQFNFIKIGYHNHLNYQGLILINLLEMIKQNKLNLNKLGFIFQLKNKFLKKYEIKSELSQQGKRKNFFQ